MREGDPPDDSGCEDDGGEEVSGELVVASGDATKVLESSEHALDEVTLAIGDDVMGDQGLTAGDRRNYRLSSVFGDEPPEGIGIVGLVRDEPPQRPGEAAEGRAPW